MEIKERMKEEALKRMKLLGMHKNAISEFEKENRLNKSVMYGMLFWLTEEEKQLVNQWQEETGNLVYHVIENQFEFGTIGILSKAGGIMRIA